MSPHAGQQPPLDAVPNDGSWVAMVEKVNKSDMHRAVQEYFAA